MILKLVLATVTDANYGRFALFALCTKDFKATGAAFGEPQFSTFLKQELAAIPTATWRNLCKAGLEAIWDAYKKYGIRYRKLMGKELKLANFEKSQECLGKFIKQPPSRRFQQLAKV